MPITLPEFKPPDFSKPSLCAAPPVLTEKVLFNGVAPDGYHGTSNYPEYVHLGGGNWILVPESRMDCVLIIREDIIEVVEARRLKKGDKVIVGRTENGEEGIFVHSNGFDVDTQENNDKFSFRTRENRDTPFSRSSEILSNL